MTIYVKQYCHTKVKNRQISYTQSTGEIAVTAKHDSCFLLVTSKRQLQIGEEKFRQKDWLASLSAEAFSKLVQRL